MGAIEKNLIVGKGTSERTWIRWLRTQPFPHFDTIALPRTGNRLVIVAPHPDDEILACGGLISLAHKADIEVVLIAVTDGESSHPGSEIWPESRLTLVRAFESANALYTLGADIHIIRLGMKDGKLKNNIPLLTSLLQKHLHATDTVICTWREDGHPDHEAVGRVCAQVSKRFNNPLLEAPVWAWHWSHPNDIRLPWKNAIVLDLGFEVCRKKRLAIEEFKSQIEPDPSTGNPPILPKNVIEHFRRPFEIFFVSQ